MRPPLSQLEPTIRTASRPTETMRVEENRSALGEFPPAVVPRTSPEDRRFHRFLAIGLAVSLVTHAGLTLWTSLRSERPPERVTFAGQSQAIQLEATFIEPTPEPPPEPVEIQVEPPMKSSAAAPATALAKRSTAAVETVPTVEEAPLKVEQPAGSVELVRPEASRGETPQDTPAETTRQAARPKRQPPSVASAVIPPGTQKETPPDFSNNPSPRYPQAALDGNWEGTVLLRLTISASGRVEDVRIVRSSGYPILDQAAVEAVSQWRGVAATRGGRPVATEEVLPVRFRRN